MKSTFYMTHPEHGTHICYTPEDVEAHKLIGWVPMTEHGVTISDYVAPIVSQWAEIELTQPKKRGRKPKAKE